MHSTTVYLRDEGTERDVKRVTRAGSFTLQQLHDECDVTTVMECDDRGVPLPRGVTLSNPSDILRTGRHYICRKGPKPLSCVTFNSHVTVQEFALTPDPRAASSSVRMSDVLSTGDEAPTTDPLHAPIHYTTSQGTPGTTTLAEARDLAGRQFPRLLADTRLAADRAERVLDEHERLQPGDAPQTAVMQSR